MSEPTKPLEDVAVLGISCRFPGSGGYRDFWRSLAAGEDSIREIPPERWNAGEFYSHDIGAPNAGVSKWGGFLDRIDEFDNRFFNISAREARAMDPRQRILLEEVWRALEDSALVLEKLRKRRTAVFVGFMSLDKAPASPPADGYAGSGNAGCMLANRVSHFFDFRGPSLGIDTASSSSLVALHQAKEILRSGEVDFAVVAGVSLNLTPWKYISFSKARMLSPDGRCKAFDRSANGYAPGEGVGVLVLQRADRAAEDGNFIHGLVKGSAVNHGGLAASLTAPEVAAQRDVIERAQADAGVSPGSVTYVEAHGSGTSLGDPIEVEALVQAFRSGTDAEQFCHLGSVKTNIGHLEPAAGIAGVIKVLAMMRHRAIPASLHMQALNPMLDLQRSPFKLVDRLTPWIGGPGPLRAGVSSFGFGGVNSHVVMESAPEPARRHPPGAGRELDTAPLPFVLSARTPASLRGLVGSWLDFVRTAEFECADWGDICGTLLVREPFSCRVAWWISKDGLERALMTAGEPVAPAEQTGPLALALGSFASFRRKDVQEFATKNPLARREWAQVCASLGELLAKARLREALKFSARFWGPRPALWELSVGLLLARLARLWLPGIGLVGGEGAGLQVALCASGMIGETEALRRALAPGKSVGRALGRPRVPYFDPERRLVVWPVAIPANYLPELFAQAVLSAADQRELTTRAVELAAHQPTFRRFLEGWQVPLEEAGENIWEWWRDADAGRAGGAGSGRALLQAVVAGDALRRLNKKWELGRRGLPSQPRFLEVLALLDVGLIERGELIQFLKGGKADAVELARTATERARGMRSAERFPLLASLLRLEPGDGPSSTGPDSPPLPPEFFAGNLVVRAGELRRSAPGTLALLEAGADLGASLGQSLASAWRAGVAVNWERTPWGAAFSRLPLPLYSFDRSRFGADTAPAAYAPDAHDGLRGAGADESLAGIERLREELNELLVGVLRIKRDEMDEKTDFREYGMESVALTDFAESIGQRYGMELDPVLLFEHPNLRSVARYLFGAYPAKFGGRVLPNSGSTPAGRSGAREPSPGQPKAPAAEPQPDYGSNASDLPADAVAIVGMACRFPKSDNPLQYWDNLASGRDLVSEVPPSRWRWQDFFGDPHLAENKTRSRWGGFLDHADSFDASFFKVSPREAGLMDPQQRWMLELTWEALEDAGCPPATLRGSSTGVFVGVSNHDYQTLVEERHSRTESYTATGGQFSIIPNRISYFFDWRGPSLAIDTACSSSLVALDAAVKALQRGDCTAAIAGGANLCCVPGPYLSFDHAGMLSKDGRCKTFDRSADGYVRGEGAGVVLLKPLARAVADGDRILAVVRGTAVNHGGIANSLTAPNPGAQAELLVKAYRSAGIPPSTVGYVEAHGTGTKLGDPIEIAGLKKAFAELAGFFGEQPPRAPHCVIGSVKANIGHLESAAGIAGVIKTVLAIQNRKIPGLVHFESLNPLIDLEGSPFRIATDTAAWLPVRDAGGRTLPLRAGVSSFGFGGANAHVVLEEWVGSAKARTTGARKPELVLLSARNPERLAEMAAEFERLASRLAAAEPGETEAAAFSDLALTLRQGREAMECRLAVIAADPKELAAELRLFLAGESSERLWSGSARKGGGAVIGADASEEDRRYLSDLITGRKLAKLASLWAGGASVDWAKIPRDGARIVSLPTYRFARESHWVAAKANPAPGPASGTEHPRVHPLIDSREDVGEDAVYRRTFTRGDAVWSDHVVSSDPVLPAAAMLEMARAAGADALGQGSIRSLRHVVFVSPLRSLGAELGVEMVVSRKGGGLQFELHDRSSPGASLRSRGKLVPASGAPGQTTSGRLDLDGIRGRCRVREAGAALYARFARGGLAYGPAYQVIEELWGNSVEALSRLRLPAAGGDPRRPEGLSPSLLDGALQTAWGIGEAVQREDGPLYLPFTIDEVEIESFLPAEVFAHAVLTDEADGSRTFQIGICDGKGRVLVLLNRVVMRRTNARERSGANGGVPAAARAPAPAGPATRGESANGISANGASANGSHPSTGGSNGVKSGTADTASAVREIESRLVQIISEVLRIKGAELDLGTDLGDYGIESVSLMEAVMEIEKNYEIVLDPSAITQHSTIANLARHLLPLVVSAGKAAAGGPPAPPEELAIAQEGAGHRAIAPSARQEAARSVPEPIAVIGAAGRFADSANLEEFWRHLQAGDHLVREIPEERWANDDYYSDDPKAPNSTYSKWGSFLADIDAFDAAHFGVKEEDAVGMDPQQRILLELSQELFDRSGYSRGELKGRPVAFFLGAAPSDYTPNRLPYAPSVPQRQVIVNQLANMAAARVSDFFHLRGPSMAVDTACSASLVALHQACQSLRLGECEMAIAGGIQLLIDPSFFVGFSQAGILSRSGRCAVFDEKADGMVLGEGAGLVLLKPLGKALRDGDHILATILGSAVNNDGHTMGITTPSLEAQQEVIAAAYAQAGIDPSSVSYLEAHGTGTALGDPLEIKAASQMFRTFTAENQFCAVGSVKSNVGHLLRAAGIAGFLKIVLALGHRLIPPTLHCTRPHPRFGFADSPFYPVTRAQEWKPRQGVRRAGISAFGFGGTNCHLLLEEFDASARGHTSRRAPLSPTEFRRKRFWAGRPTVPVDGGLSEAGLRDLLRGVSMGRITVGEARTLIERC
jgi:acyl transferase domain-containing protein